MLVVALLVGLIAAPSSDYFYRQGQRVALAAHPSVIGYQPAQSLNATATQHIGIERVTQATTDISFVELNASRLRSRSEDQLLRNGIASRVVPTFTTEFGGVWIPTKQLLVKPRSEADEIAVQRLARALGLQEQQRVLERTIVFVAEDEASAVSAANHLFESQLCEYAAPNFIRDRVLHKSQNDQYYDLQWHFQRINAEAAWERSEGSPDITIAIIDTGVEAAHPDLQGKLVHPYDAATDTPGTAEPVRTVADGAHGTACAGDAAASTNNSIGVAGVCPQCKVMPIRLLAFGEATEELADIKAFEWAIEHNADIISNSWGDPRPAPVPEPLAEVIRRAVTEGRNGKGAIVMFAAGNSYRVNRAFEMASMPEVISVGASAPNDRRFAYSDYGPYVQFLSPSAAVTTDLTGSAGYDPSAYTNQFGGTSSACPVAAGVVGLLLATHPELDSRQVKWILTQSARKVHAAQADYDAAGFSQEFGFGVIDAQAALTLADAGGLCEPSGRVEICDNSVDDDCNSLTDRFDPACAPTCLEGCPAGTECDPTDNRCRLIGTGAPVGGACTVAEQCEDGVCFTDSQGFPEGYCSASCAGGSACAEGSLCVDLADGAFCLTECDRKGDCRRGYVCKSEGSNQGVCAPACDNDNDCTGSATCDLSSGFCTGDEPNGGGRLSVDAEDPLAGDTNFVPPTPAKPKAATSETLGKSGCAATGGNVIWSAGLWMMLVLSRTARGALLTRRSRR